MRFVVVLVSAIVTLCLGLASAHAEKRVALVIGNSDYQKVGALPNPERDAAAMGELFRQVGFDRVDIKTNLNQAGLRKALRDFSDAVSDADIAVVFYAGHGIEVSGTNYLIPTDAMLQHDIDVEDETVSLDRVSQLIAPARRLQLIILDACRDNPFTPSMRHTVASRSIGRGLQRVEVQTADTMVAFAAKPGSIAADGNGANSPYTVALLHNLATPGLDIRLAMGRVRDEVLASTKRQQEPTVFTSLGGAEISLVPRTEGPAAQASGQNTPGQDAAGQAWAAIKDTTSIAILEEFVRKFGASFYAGFARVRIDELRKTKVAVVVPPVVAPPAAVVPPAAVAPPAAVVPASVTAPLPNLPVQLGTKNQESIRAYIACINRLSERSYQSRSRYFSWAAKSGPTGKERNIYGLYTIYDTSDCQKRVEAANAREPHDAALEAAATAYVSAVTKLEPLLKEADDYYTQQNYKDDKMAKGQALHPRLVAAWDEFASADQKLRKGIEVVNDRRSLGRLAAIEKSEGHNAHYHIEVLMIHAKRVINTMEEGGTPDLAKLTPALTEYENTIKATEQLVGTDDTKIDSMFINNAKSFLTTAKQLMRRIRDKVPYSTGEKMMLNNAISGWMVEGSPPRLTRDYNELVESYNRGASD